MTRDTNDRILLVGAGNMAQVYAKVLQALDFEFLALGRGKNSAESFAKATGVAPTTGPLEQQLVAMKHVPETAIVAVNAMHLSGVAITLMKCGVKRLLLEKPGALDLAEMATLTKAVADHGAKVFVGYNRRFMASTRRAQEMIAEDGGVSSIKFDFSEPARRIAKLGKPERELDTWFYGNSSHVVDLAFHLFGDPVELSAQVSGALDWHPTAAVFGGWARNASDALMTWHANWSGPGRWGVEVMTPERRIIMQPLEKLEVQTHASFAEAAIDVDDADDLKFKPGVKSQVTRFLTGTGPDVLPTLAEHAARMQYFEKVRSGGGMTK